MSYTRVNVRHPVLPDQMAEPMLSFHHAGLKILWANELINDLKVRIDDFINNDPWNFELKDDPNPDQHHLNVGLKRDIPPEIILQTGDICASLRQALDYAWMGIVRIVNPDKKNEKKTLPIGNTRKDLEGRIARDYPDRPPMRQTKRLLVERIKAHSDFSNGGNRTLIALNALSNWNKHNLTIITVGQTTGTFIWGNNNAITFNVEGTESPFFSFIGRTRPDITHQIEPSSTLVFGRGMPVDGMAIEGQPLFPTLVNFYKMALDGLNAFCEVFPSADNPTFT